MATAKRTAPKNSSKKQAAPKTTRQDEAASHNHADAPNQIQIDLLAARIAATQAQQLAKDLLDLALSDAMRKLATSDPAQFAIRIKEPYCPGLTFGWSKFASDEVLSVLRGDSGQPSAQERAIEHADRIGNIFDPDEFYRGVTVEMIARIISQLEVVESWDSSQLTNEILKEWREADLRAAMIGEDKIDCCLAAWHWCRLAYFYCYKGIFITRQDGSQSSISLFEPELEELLKRRLRGISKDLDLEGEVFRRTDKELVESWKVMQSYRGSLPQKSFSLRCDAATLVFESEMKRQGELAKEWEAQSWRLPIFPTQPVNTVGKLIAWMNSVREPCFQIRVDRLEEAWQFEQATISLRNAHRTLYMLGLTKRDDCPKPSGDPTNLIDAEWQFNAITLFAEKAGAPKSGGQAGGKSDDGDDASYRPASELWRQRSKEHPFFKNYPQFKRWLDDVPNTEIPRRKPAPQRLEIHAGKWMAYWKRIDEERFELHDTIPEELHSSLRSEAQARGTIAKR